MKKLWTFLMILIAVFSINAKAEDTLEKMDGLKKHTFSHKPYIIETTTDEKGFMIPLRETLEVLGFKVDWKGGGFIDVSKGMFKASLKIGSNEYKDRDGKIVNLYANPEMIEGVTYVPHVFFYYVLGYDAFYIRDTLFIRYKIDDIVPQVMSKVEFSDKTIEVKEKEESASKNKKEEKMEEVKPVRFAYAVYPVVEKESHRFMNDSIRDLVSKIINDKDYDQIYIKYDVGIYSEDILSVIFTGKAFKNGKEFPICESITLDTKNKSIITPDNFLKEDSEFRKSIADDINEMLGGTDFSYKELGFYFVKDAVIFYKISGEYLPNKYVKLADLDKSINSKYRYIFAN